MTGYAWQNYSSHETGCDHYQLTHVMDIGKAKIYAGSRLQAEAEYGWKLMVCLLGHSFTPPGSPVKMNKEAGIILPPSLVKYDPPALVTVDWPDGGVPALGQLWWSELYTALAEVDGDVVFFCFGGHGRTGTALSILAGFGGLLKKGCPVLWVRKNYCQKAVETTTQIKYVEEITGIKVKAISSAAIAAQKKAAMSPPLPTAPATGSETSGQQTELPGVKPGETALVTTNPGGEKEEWVRDPQTGLLMRKSEMDQDWSAHHHSFSAP